ncbi:MAG: AarF/ABC1/UbiB kinase family protein [Deltaproteobacteria bacterium]|nr:MAG: AarF/ABC1/UbiB kinase family protein [Deltaproteobacteria bacterium]
MARDRKGSRLGRLARLGGLTGRVGTSYVGQKVKEVFLDGESRDKARQRLHLDNAREIVSTLGRLKGAAMKVGQQVALLSDQLDLPPEVANMLGRLHNKAEAVPFPTIREDIEAELEMPLSEAFSWFDPLPLGTASLGQAHAARLPDGTDVVVKVLHRGVDISVDTDLLALKTLLLGSVAFRRDRAEIDALFDEIAERLKEELDYLQEAANIAAFNRAFGDDPRIRLPQVYGSHSTERVLTMSRLHGKPLDEFLETADEAARQRAGVNLAELYYEMVFVHRMLHADPHPGNYLYEPDGRVGFIDFGCVKRFDEFWIAHYGKAALAALEGDKPTVLAECREIGGWHGDTPEAGEALWSFCDMLAEPFREDAYVLGGHKDSILDRIQGPVRDIMRYPEVRMPRDLIFLHRSLAGLYSMARRLQVRADFGAILTRNATIAIQRAEGA